MSENHTEYRLGILYEGRNVPHYVATSEDRWGHDALIWLRFGDVSDQKRMVWLEKREVILTGWTPPGGNDDRRRWRIRKVLSEFVVRRSNGWQMVALAYRNATEEARRDHPEVDWDSATVSIELEVLDA